MLIPKVTLEQWATFKAVVDEGTFAKAAERLNKSQSSISYTISKLEAQLPSPVLTLNGRKAELTEEGKVLYRSAKQLLIHAEEIEQTASCLADGWETEITIGFDSIVEIQPLFNAIDKFTVQAPHTRVTLLESTLSGTTENLLERRADIVLSANPPPGFLGQPIGTALMIPVAHKNHELARAKGKITEQMLKNQRQIVVRDSGTKRNQDTGWLGSEQRLTVTHFTHSVEALIRGLGFAFIPEHLASPLIKTNQLKRLDLQSNAERRLQIYLIMTSTESAGLASKALQKILLESFNVEAASTQ